MVKTIKANAGELKVETKEGKFAEFVIKLHTLDYRGDLNMMFPYYF